MTTGHTSYLATCRVCGGWVAVTSNRPEYYRDTAREVARWVRTGLVVNEMPSEEARKHLAEWCNCERRPTGG